MTNFLSEYIVNAFNSGLFTVPEFEIPQGFFSEQSQKFLFEISNVQLLADLSALKIHWLTSIDENVNVEVEAYFDKRLRNEIRSRLVSERVINYVPRIVFVRDNSRVVMEKLDEYLKQVKLEETEEKEDNEENVSKEGDTQKEDNEKGRQANFNESSKKLVNDLYGVDFQKLVDVIRKDGHVINTEWKPPISGDDMLDVVDKAKDVMSVVSDVNDRKSFVASLRAFEIQKRKKMEKLNKSTLAKLAQIEAEASRG